MTNRFHCCATCQHFSATKNLTGGMNYKCIRLGFDTKPTHTFNCWNPTEKVKRLMTKRSK